MTLSPVRLVARIDEAQCIGCARCIEACPIDSIVGAPKWMHTVMPDLCSGCALCVAPCPVDCIDMARSAQAPWSEADDAAAERRKAAQEARRVGESTRAQGRTESRRRRAVIAAAIARKKASRIASLEEKRTP